MTMTTQELDRIFTYHAPKNDQPGRYKTIRDAARTFAEVIIKNSLESHEQTRAIDLIQEAVMWANAGIARNEW
jgi:hypothetical protein